MSIQDRDWYRESWAEKENREKNNKTISSSYNSKNTNSSNRNRVFQGRALDTKSEKGKFYTRVVCGNCNFINTVEQPTRPNGTYEFICMNCKEKVNARIVSYSIGMWILFFISLAILYFIFKG